MSQTLIAQAAEAKIYKEGNQVIKDRISKSYRHPELDKKLIKQRTKKEAKLLEKASKLINAPLPTNLEETEKSRTNQIIMPYIEGLKLSEHLEQLDWKSLCKIIGNQIAKLHDNNIIHGDLTTSNMILVDNYCKEEKGLQLNKSKSKGEQDFSKDICPNNKTHASNRASAGCEASQKASDSEPKLYFIDFGLGFTSERIEDRAVDLHLIKQALEAKHFSIHKEAEQIILDNYNSKEKVKVLEQLKKVESRGRYRH